MSGEILFAEHGDGLFIKLRGKITFGTGSAFNDFIDRQFASGTFGDVLVDLTETTAIDSTNLGLLAKIAKRMRVKRPDPVTLVSTNPEITAIVANVGLDRVFRVIDRDDDAPDDLSALPGQPTDRRALGNTMLEAHRELMALNEKNADAFRNVVEFLEDDLAS